jgi:UDP-2-acetamido-3-amino-2,3-dideoxy-glucuronate N-acetyltransferase
MCKGKYIAVAGAGYWGKNLVRNFFELGVLHSICDQVPETLQTFSEKYPEIRICRDYQELLTSNSIYGIVLSVPAEQHYPLAKQALLAGKHVFVEKPLALELRQAEELVELARQKKRILMVGHLMQYHSAFRKLKELIHDGVLGKIYYIYSNRLSLGKIRQEENTLWSFAPHDISMILSLCNEEPCKVTATGGNYLQKRIADVTVTHMEFPSGIKAHIFVSWLHPFKEQKLIVVGKEKMAVFSDTEEWGKKLVLYSHSINWNNGIPVPLKADPELVKVEKCEPLRSECQHFLDCLNNNHEPITDGQEGLRVLKVLTQAQACIG